MATDAGFVDSDVEYGEVLTDSNVAQFLASNSWTCQVDRKFDQVWVQPGQLGERLQAVLLPREASFADYGKRLREAVSDIAQVYGWGLSQFAEQVAAIHADLFFVRVDQQSKDGTIPLKQATALLEGIDQMIRAAAITAYNPRSTGRGRVPEMVKDFLADDVRMGHTKKGSFIITVAARLDDLLRVEPSDGVDVGEERIPSFTRQVTTTLARSLEVTRRFAARGDDFVEFDAAVDQGLKLPLVQALQDITDADGVRSVDMSFEWASAEPQRVDVPARIVMNREVIDVLPEVESRLIRTVQPEAVMLVGPVTELKRTEVEGSLGDDEEGEIVVRAEVFGRLGRIVVPLSGKEYDWAIRAHRERLPFTVSGQIGKRGNVWRLSEPIEVDKSFLEHRLGDSRP